MDRPVTSEAQPTGTVTVRYWAGARAAAGVTSDVVVAGCVGDALDEATRRHPLLVPVVAVATFLVDGVASAREATLPAGSTVEILPPFAGG